ncbi:MAG: hypothetical protein CL833_10485 [Crocinitomicaceae bacterium]|nr:hypothetical protein [Crocinitomicaceae bacterium]
MGNKIYLIALILLAVKVLVLPFAQPIDADAYSRLILAESWLAEPSFSPSSQWLPVHFYLLGLGLKIWHNTLLIPALISALFSSLTVIPLFRFLKSLTTEKGAFIATVLFAFSPLVFSNSIQGLSMALFIFLFASAIYSLSKSIQNHKWIWTGMILFALAALTRYEAWMMLPVVGYWLFRSGYRWQWIFLCTAPIIWLIYSNSINLEGFQWITDSMNEEMPISAENRLRRIWFFPFSLFVGFGPILIYAFLKKGEGEEKNRIFLIPFLYLLTTYLLLSSIGTLLLQHRFTIFLLFLLTPFLSVKLRTVSIKTLAGALILTIGLSFLYNQKGTKPIPRLHDQEIIAITDYIKNKQGSFIIRFIGWEETYYIARQLKHQGKKIRLYDGENLEGFDYCISYKIENATPEFETNKFQIDKIN